MLFVLMYTREMVTASNNRRSSWIRRNRRRRWYRKEDAVCADVHKGKGDRIKQQKEQLDQEE